VRSYAHQTSSRAATQTLTILCRHEKRNAFIFYDDLKINQAHRARLTIRGRGAYQRKLGPLPSPPLLILSPRLILRSQHLFQYSMFLVLFVCLHCCYNSLCSHYSHCILFTICILAHHVKDQSVLKMFHILERLRVCLVVDETKSAVG